MSIIHWDGMQWGREGQGGFFPGPSDSADWDSQGFLWGGQLGIGGPFNERYADGKSTTFDTLKKTFPNTATIIVGHWWRNVNAATAEVFRLIDTGTVQVVAEGALVAGKMQMQLRRGVGGPIIAQTANLFSIGVWRWLSWKIQIGNSATVSLKVDGFQEFSAAGVDSQNSGSAQCNAFELYPTGIGSAHHGTIVLCDTTGAVMNDHILPVRSAVQYPTGVDAGTFNDWTASAGTRTSCVDETMAEGPSGNPNETDWVASGTVGQKQSFPLTNSPTGITIRAYRVSWKVKRDDATPRQCRAFIRNAGGAIHNFPTRTIPASWETFTENLTLSPFTGLAFTKAEIDGYQLGVEVMA